ncbi:MAG: baseplate J/gp47 family protein, partial [Candidatus Limnocylindrales bacterium]
MAIYYLDVDDEITSAAARIRDSSDSRIALVLSVGSRVATSRINFRLLAGEAKHRNKRLAIIAADPSVQSVARSAELPVYASVGEYERAEAATAGATASRPSGAVVGALDGLALTVGPSTVAPRGGRTGATRAPGLPAANAASKRGRRVPKLQLAGVGLLVAALVTAGAYFFYPSATVVLTLRGEPVGPITVSVKVDPGVIATNYQAGTVPGIAKAFPVQASDTFAATGENVVEAAAKGSVTFTSLNTFLDVVVPKGTPVSTAAGIQFGTDSAVSVKKATVSGTTITPGTADVTITAVTAGLSGNVAANTIVKVPADLAAALVNAHPVTNKEATSGGTHDVTPKIQQSDIDAAEAALQDRLQSDFQLAWKAPGAAPSGSSLLPESARLGTATCNPDPAGLVDKPVATFQLDCRGTGTVIVADMASVMDLVKRRVGAAVRTGYSLVEESVATKIGTGIVQGTALVLPVTVQGVQVPAVDIDQLRAAIKGKSVDDARALLSQYGQVDIALSPGWASTMPSFDFRIDIRLVLPSVAAASSPSASAGASGAHAGQQTSGG